MPARPFLRALGTTACVAAVICRATSAALLAFDAAITALTPPTPTHVPAHFPGGNR